MKTSILVFALFCALLNFAVSADQTEKKSNLLVDLNKGEGKRITTKITGDGSGLPAGTSCIKDESCSFPYVCNFDYGSICEHQLCQNDSDCRRYGTGCNLNGLCADYHCDPAPCPQGFQCKMVSYWDGEKEVFQKGCVPDSCGDKCDTTQVCDGNVCVDAPCGGKCSSDEKCEGNVCVVDAPCFGGCPKNEVCDTTSNVCQAQETSKLPIIIGAAVGAVAIIAICVGLFIFYKKKKGKEGQEETSSETSTKDEPPQPHNY